MNADCTRHFKLLLIATFFLATGMIARAQVAFPEDTPAERIRYNVELKDPAQHLVHVQMQLPPGVSQRDVQLPVWNATYMVRDFAQNVNHFQAENNFGRPITVERLTGSSWRMWGAERGATVQYDQTLDVAGPFGAQFNDHHAFLNLAMVLMYPVDGRATPVQLTFSGIPKSWAVATPAMAPGGIVGGIVQPIYVAANYDRLVDSPVEMGTFRQTTFEANGAGFTVVVDADPGDYDLDAIAAMLKKIVTAEMTWMNDHPFTHYMFLYHFPRGPAGGGMEHAYGTAIDSSVQRVKGDPTGIADVTAHEFFHLWNVKRIRPQSLEPVDYTKEQYSRALWFSEGFTSTLSPYTLIRAGIRTEQQTLDSMARAIGQMQQQPAHKTMSAEESSLTTWFDKYPIHFAADRSISYYTKGEIVGVLLDLAMLDATNGQKGLRELFRFMNDQYAKQGRFFDDSAGVRDAAEVVAGRSFREFFEKYVSGTDEIPYDDFFRTVGLRLNHAATKVADAGLTISRGAGSTPGTISGVASGSNAEKAGLRPGDIITDVNGQPYTAASARTLADMKPGDTAKVKVTRNGRAQEISFALGSRDEEQYTLVDVEGVTQQQKDRRAVWLGCPNGETVCAQAPPAGARPQ